MPRTNHSAIDSGREQNIKNVFVKRATVSIETLLPAESPRSSGEDQEHIRRLAENDAELPPILVQRGSMRVIDGMHRLHAALLNGRGTIEVEFFDGNDEEAFMCAVERNVTHGLPLTLADRKVAAARILGWRPALSDRSVASMTGLSPKTVGAIRTRAAAELPPSNERQGRDGRLRAVDTSKVRLRAVAIMRENPDASVREIAASAGISPGTVRSVQTRLRAGDDPVLNRPRQPGGADGRQADGAGDVTGPSAAHAEIGGAGARGRQAVDEISSILGKLYKDPALRHSEAGRRILQVIRSKAVDDRSCIALIEASPPHARPLIAKLARCNASVWKELASELDKWSVELTASFSVSIYVPGSALLRGRCCRA